MKYYARRIDDASQRVATVSAYLHGNVKMYLCEFVFQTRRRVASFSYFLLHAKEHGSSRTNHGVVRFGLKNCRKIRAEQEVVERGQQAIQAAYVRVAGGALAVSHTGKCIFLRSYAATVKEWLVRPVQQCRRREPRQSWLPSSLGHAARRVAYPLSPAQLRSIDRPRFVDRKATCANHRGSGSREHPR